MHSHPANGNDRLVKRTKTCCLLLLGFILLFGWFGIRLVTTENAGDWKEADISIADVQHISKKPNRWEITDTNGNRYTAHEPQEIMSKVLSKHTYHIFYTVNDNDIRAMANDDSIVIDYAHSMSVHCERNIWDWLLAFLGLGGAVTIIACMVIDIRKNMIRG